MDPQKHDELLFRDIDGIADGYEKNYISDSSKIIKQINNMRDTIYSLEKSYNVSRCLEAEQCSRFRKMKIHNVELSNNLKEVEQRNTIMLNLFRANVTDELPMKLKNQVRRTWQQKYDALLSMNTQLRQKTYLNDVMIKEKNCEISILQQQLLNIGEKLMERNEAVKNICNKYLTLKKQKDEQEIIIRELSETLKDSSITKTNEVNMTSNMSRMSLVPTQEALLVYETKRCNRLTRENCLLRASLQHARINYKCYCILDDI